MKNELSSHSSGEWSENVKSLFLLNIPDECKWTSFLRIAAVLNKISSGKSGCDLYFAQGGKELLSRATFSYEDGCIELIADWDVVLKIKSLEFNSIENNLEWSYFYIHTDRLNPSGSYVPTKNSWEREALIEYTPTKYFDRDEYFYRNVFGEELPKPKRYLDRLLTGDLVIFSRSSVYSQMNEHLDGRHAKMGPAEFKYYVKGLYAKECEKKTKGTTDDNYLDFGCDINLFL